ncbi:MAG: CoA-binding protein [Treponema sp.]|nr:CoA-binding protein [Treponema sp.]
MKQTISKPARERLIQLARLLEHIENDSRQFITSSEIQNLTGWSSYTIRRDISHLKTECSTKAGYDIVLLKNAIGAELGITEGVKKCCIVGLGKLGSALIDFDFGKSYKIVAGFDSSVNRTEILTAPFPLYPTGQMQNVIKQEGIELAILAVPGKVAQDVATKLAGFGIKGIVNYTSAILSVGEDAIVENISLIDALQKIASLHAKN